jgi:hypothetical protein
MGNKLIAGVVFATALAAASVPTHASTIVADGNFSGAPNPFQTINSGSTFGATGSWLVTSGSIDWIGNYWAPPPGGGGSVDLDGNSVGSISQDLGILGPGTYKLTFYLSGNPDGPPDPKVMQVSFGGQTSLPLDAPRPPPHTVNYALETLYFTLATSGDTVLSFASLDGPPGFYGPVIGDVSVSATPLPSTWTMLIAGFVGFGFLAYRRTRNGSAAIAAA